MLRRLRNTSIRSFGQPAFWIMAVGLHVFGMVWQWQTGPWLLEDSHEYLFAARNLAEHGVLYAGDWDAPERMDDYSKRPPVYPVLLWWTGAHRSSFFLILLLQNMLSLGGIWWISVMTRRVSGHEPPWWLWAAILVVTPSQWIYPQLIMTEILFQVLLLVLGTLLWKSVTEQKTGLWWIMAIVIVLAFLTKPVWYLFVIPFFGWALYRAVSSRKWSLILAGIAPAILLLGYMQWNESRTGYFHMSSIQVLSLHQYTTTNLLVDAYGPEAGFRKADSILYEALAAGDYPAEQKTFQSASAAVIRDHLPRYSLMHLKGMVNFFLDPGRFDLWSFFHLPPPDQGFLQVFSEGGYRGILTALLGLPLGWLFFLGLVFLGNLVKTGGLLLFCWRYRRQAIAWVLIILFGYLAGLTGTSGASRFMVPLFPWLLLALSFPRQRADASKTTGA